MYPEILANHYNSVDWKRQFLIFGTLANIGISQYSSSPAQTKLWTGAEEAATWTTPSTFHRLFTRRNAFIDSGTVDTIPALFVDIDYPAEKPYFGEVFLSLLELDLSPTLLVETPHGYHAWYFLDAPLVMRWTKTDSGIWAPLPGAAKALAYWKDVSRGLCRRLIIAGIPADPAAAGSPARLMRKPTAENVRMYDEHNLWTLDQISKRIEAAKIQRISVPLHGRRVGVFGGVAEGERNAACWRLALGLAASFPGAEVETGKRALLEFAARCTPPYPEREALAVWKWAARLAAEGRIFSEFSYTAPERSRQEQGPYARKIHSLAIDAKIDAAIERMIAAGVADPWEHPRALAREAAIPEKTIQRRKKNLKNQ